MQIILLNINAAKHKGREIADQSNTVSLSFINLLGQQMQISTRKRKSSNIMLAGHCILLFVYTTWQFIYAGLFPSLASWSLFQAFLANWLISQDFPLDCTPEA